MSNLTPIERSYVAQYREAIAAVCHVGRYVTRSQSDSIDALEAMLSESRIEQLREMARR